MKDSESSRVGYTGHLLACPRAACESDMQVYNSQWIDLFVVLFVLTGHTLYVSSVPRAWPSLHCHAM